MPGIASGIFFFLKLTASRRFNFKNVFKEPGLFQCQSYDALRVVVKSSRYRGTKFYFEKYFALHFAHKRSLVFVNQYICLFCF
jgi:hypothetical protein